MSKQSQLPETPKPKTVYPSEFGSHESMVNAKLTEKLGKPDLVVCEDDDGPYVTERNRLGSWLADPNRYSSMKARDMKLHKLVEEKPEESPAETPAEAN